MPNGPIDPMWEQFWPMVDGAVMGALGGIVNGLRQKTFKEVSQVIAAVLTAGFAGTLAHLVTSWIGADVRLQFAMSGIAGYSGGVLLDDIVKRARELLNKGGDVLANKLEDLGDKGKHTPDDSDKKATPGGEAETYIVVPKWE